MHTLFVIDVSRSAFNFLNDVCEAIRETLYGSDAVASAAGRFVGIIAFDSSLYFYNLSVR